VNIIKRKANSVPCKIQIQFGVRLEKKIEDYHFS